MLKMRIKNFNLAIVLLMLFGSMSLKAQENQVEKYQETKSFSLSLGYSAMDELLPEGYAYSPLSFLGQYRFAPFGAFNLYGEVQFARTGTANGGFENYGFGLNLGISYNLQLSKSLAIFSSLGSGPYYVTVETRRQASGFIFSDNIELGINYLMPASTTAIQLRARFRHISNAGLNSPNGGIDNLFLVAAVNKAF